MQTMACRPECMTTVEAAKSGRDHTCGRALQVKHVDWRQHDGMLAAAEPSPSHDPSCGPSPTPAAAPVPAAVPSPARSSAAHSTLTAVTRGAAADAAGGCGAPARPSVGADGAAAVTLELSDSAVVPGVPAGFQMTREDWIQALEANVRPHRPLPQRCVLLAALRHPTRRMRPAPDARTAADCPRV